MDHPIDPVPRYTAAAGTSNEEITPAPNNNNSEDADHKQPGEADQAKASGNSRDYDFYSRISHADSLPLPILAVPSNMLGFGSRSRRNNLSPTPIISEENRGLILDIVISFFTSVRSSRDELVRDFVARGLVSPDVKDTNGQTPLLVAIHGRNMPMIRTLLSLGALVDGFGASPIVEPKSGYSDPAEYPQRTPLQLAAQIGYLAGVKCLMEEHGADDSIVAPDGAIALRLAAEGGHREVVDYLPQRRAGAWLRWKTAHRREMRVLRRAMSGIRDFVVFFVWRLPKFFLYEIPVRTAQSVWRNRRKIVQGVVELPKRVTRATKRVAKRFVKEIKRLPEHLSDLIDAIVRFLKAIPATVRIIFGYISRAASKAGGAVWELVQRVASLLHTVVMAVVTFFKTVTFKDIRDGLGYVLNALFIAIPTALFSFVKNFGEMSYDMMKTLLGCLGKVIWWVCRGILWLLEYIPNKLWECAKSIGRLVKRGTKECLVYLDPKRM